jgi:hypothetical protein
MRAETCKVVMLPKGAPFQDGDLIHNPTMNTLFVATKGLKHGWAGHPAKHLVAQHLYVTSSEKIKLSDWYYVGGHNTPDYSVIEAVSYRLVELANGSGAVYKIIASTNPALNLPGIPEQFLQNYCEASGINEIGVLYDSQSVGGGPYFKVVHVVHGNLISIVTVKPVAERTFTKDDVQAAWNAAISAEHNGITFAEFEDWFSKNYK